MPRKHILTIAVLIPWAFFWSLAALVGRADSSEDLITGKIVDWIILGPSWDGVVYIAMSAVIRTHPRRLQIAIGSGIVVWVAVALTANSWEDQKMEMRMYHIKQSQNPDVKSE